MPKTCDKYGTFITKDNKAISAGRWGQDSQFCIETTGDSGFTITDSALNKNGVAAYPSFYEGMWPRTDNITKNSKFPAQLSSFLKKNELYAEFDFKGGSGHFNCAFDLWFSESKNVNYKLELMIWNYHTGMSPAGSKVDTFNAWDVWVGFVGGIRVVSYVRRDKSSFGHILLPLTVFMEDCIKRGYLESDDYLTSVQNGFEVWRNGKGCSITNYSVEYKALDKFNTHDVPPVNLPKENPVANAEYIAKLDSIPGSSFKSTSWNNEHGYGWPPPIRKVGDGSSYIEFALPANGKRIEVEPNHRTFGGSGQAFFLYDFLLEDNYPLDANTWQVIWQLHGNDTTSPRFALQARNNQLRVGDNQKVCDIQKNTRYKVVILADFSNGKMQVWVNGKDLGTFNVGKSNPAYYLKFGYYRDSSIGRTGTVRCYGAKLGSSYDAVAPSASVPSQPSTGGQTGSQEGNGNVPTLDEKLGMARKALCGDVVGYPDTLFNSVVLSITRITRTLAKLDIGYPPLPVTSQSGPFWKVNVASDDIAQQLASRFSVSGTNASVRELTDYLETLTDLLPQ